jgi:hypothetical protein
MRKLLILASVGEIAFGLLLLAVPVPAARWLLAVEISGRAISVGRVAGACLIALGIGCWPRGESRRRLYIMMAYSALAACGLVVIGLWWSAGVLLWPAVVVHGAIALLLWINR